LFRPGYWMDQIYAPTVDRPGAEILTLAESVPPGEMLTLRVRGVNVEGDEVNKVVTLPMGAPGEGLDRVTALGLDLRFDGSKAVVDSVGFESAAQKAGVDFDFEILNVQVKADRPAKQLMYIPGLLVMGLIIMLQRRRRRELA